MRSDFRHWHPIDVRWGDMDAFGHVNNTAYFVYMESGRVAYFDELGLWDLSQPGVIGPAVVSLTCNFRGQVRYPDRLEVGSRVTEVHSRKFTLVSEIYRAGSEELVADGSCVTVWVDYRAGRAIPFPDALAQAIQTFEGHPA